MASVSPTSSGHPTGRHCQEKQDSEQGTQFGLWETQTTHASLKNSLLPFCSLMGTVTSFTSYSKSRRSAWQSQATLYKSCTYRFRPPLVQQESSGWAVCLLCFFHERDKSPTHQKAAYTHTHPYTKAGFQLPKSFSLTLAQNFLQNLSSANVCVCALDSISMIISLFLYYIEILSTKIPLTQG